MRLTCTHTLACTRRKGKHVFGVYTVVGMHVFGVYTKKGKTFIWRVHKKKNKYAHTKKRKEKMYIFSFLLTCTHTHTKTKTCVWHERANMCLACTQWWECMRLACTQKKGKTFVWRVHTKTEQICVHKKEKKKACVWRVHTQTHVFFLFFWRVHSGGNACVWRVHKKGGNIRLACTHKKSGKHVFGVYAKKKRKK